MPQCIQKEKVTEEIDGEIDAEVVRSVLDEDEDVFVSVVSEWLQDIIGEIESRYPIHSSNRWFVGLPEANCSEGDIPLIDEFNSVSTLEKMRSRVREANFDSEISYLRDAFLKIIDSRIEQISFENKKWEVPENEVEEIESIPVCDEDLYKTEREEVDENPVIAFEEKVSEYGEEELEFLSEVLRARNYGFTSPHAVIIDTVRKSMGVDVRLDKIIDVREDEIGREQENIEKRIDNMVERMNPYILGYALSRLSFVEAVEREKIEYIPLSIISQECSLGMCANIRGIDIVGPKSASSYLVIATDEASLEAVQERVPMSVIEERDCESKEEFYQKAIKDAESIFSHEFGHHIDTCFGICNTMSRGRAGDIIDNTVIKNRFSDIKKYSSDEYDATKYMYKKSEEFFAFMFDMWVNNPDKMEEKYEEVYNSFENNFSGDISK